VAAGISGQPHARLLKGVPVGQVPGQPVDVADDDHVDRARLDRRDQLAEPVPGDFLEPENPSSLKVAATVHPRRAAWSVPPLDLVRY
jgi:hypothetical protein